MKSQPQSSAQEVLAGLVERVTFHNTENGFCVLRAKARGHRDLVTVVGHAATISAGEWITASGEWINDRTRGQQFKARFLKTSAPTSIDGIEKYLGSGMIRGIGPVYAKKLVPYLQDVWCRRRAGHDGESQVGNVAGADRMMLVPASGFSDHVRRRPILHLGIGLGS